MFFLMVQRYEKREHAQNHFRRLPPCVSTFPPLSGSRALRQSDRQKRYLQIFINTTFASSACFSRSKGQGARSREQGARGQGAREIYNNNDNNKKRNKQHYFREGGNLLPLAPCPLHLKLSLRNLISSIKLSYFWGRNYCYMGKKHYLYRRKETN